MAETFDDPPLTNIYFAWAFRIGVADREIRVLVMQLIAL